MLGTYPCVDDYCFVSLGRCGLWLFIKTIPPSPLSQVRHCGNREMMFKYVWNFVLNSHTFRRLTQNIKIRYLQSRTLEQGSKHVEKNVQLIKQ